MSRLEVLASGPLATIQDEGRSGLAALGVGVSGAADRRSLAAGEVLFERDSPADGGFVVGDVGTPAVPLASGAEARLQGYWGFQPFDGPRFRLVSPAQDAWRADGSTLVVGRETPLVLAGGAAGCVSEVWLERDGARRPVTWTAEADGTLTRIVAGSSVRTSSYIVNSRPSSSAARTWATWPSIIPDSPRTWEPAAAWASAMSA